MTESVKLLERFEIEPGAFEGKTALVTGAARGIGRQTAELLSHLGANIVIADMRSQGQAVADMITSAGGAAAFIGCDLARPEEVARVAGEAREAFGGVDIVVNSAMQMIVTPIVATALEDWERISP